jgi:hypothetical protein
MLMRDNRLTHRLERIAGLHLLVLLRFLWSQLARGAVAHQVQAVLAGNFVIKTIFLSPLGIVIVLLLVRVVVLAAPTLDQVHLILQLVWQMAARTVAMVDQLRRVDQVAQEMVVEMVDRALQRDHRMVQVVAQGAILVLVAMVEIATTIRRELAVRVAAERLTSGATIASGMAVAVLEF